MENLSDQEAKMMNAERFNSDRKLVDEGAEVDISHDGSIKVVPDVAQKEQIHREFERSENVYEALRNPELIKEIEKLESMAASLDNDFKKAVNTMQENDWSISGRSEELVQFVAELKKFLGAESGTISTVSKLGETYPGEWLLEDSHLAKDINYSSPVHGESESEYIVRATTSMIMDNTSPKQVMAIMKSKMKAALWDAAKDMGKIVV